MSLTWRELLDEVQQRVVAGDARRILERASGYDGGELWAHLGEPAPPRAVAHAKSMARRRAGGEPLQYVVGAWGFRTLDLFVDRRVLIPRPETEVVVQVALAELASLDKKATRTVVDLGTGSGAIALSMAAETSRISVLATDVSADALAVARANVAGAGSPAGARVRLLAGSWWKALPSDLAGHIDLVVSNPPYVAESEDLPPEVSTWEPATALIAGPTGLEAISAIVEEAPGWLARPGRLVLEIAPHQAGAATGIARTSGFDEVEVKPDLSGRLRVLVARV